MTDADCGSAGCRIGTESFMASAPSTNDLTRQQLDELDALLQKMLALPLSGPENASSPAISRSILTELPLPEYPTSRPIAPSFAPSTPKPNGRETSPPTVWRGEAPASTTSELQLLVVTAPSPPPPAPVTRKAPTSQPRSAESSLSLPLAENVEMPTQLVPNPFHLKTPASSIVDSPPTAPTTNEPTRSTMDSVASLLAPLVVFNRTLNAALGRLGLAGRILRSGFGKNALALSGLVLLALTAARIAQQLGWVTLSTTLPWPT
jgi:hypothetical protein